MYVIAKHPKQDKYRRNHILRLLLMPQTYQRHAIHIRHGMSIDYFSPSFQILAIFTDQDT